MNLERAAMKGKLAEAELQSKNLKDKIKGLCKSLRENLNIFLIPVEEIEIGEAEQFFQDLVISYAEFLGVTTEIEKLKRELR